MQTSPSNPFPQQPNQNPQSSASPEQQTQQPPQPEVPPQQMPPAEQQPQPKPEQKNATVKNLVTLLALIFIPPVGILLMWLLATWDKTIKVIITVIWTSFLVIALVLGFLVFVTLFSLGDARKQAKDVRIDSSMSQIRALAELVFDDSSPEGYGQLCDTRDNSLNQDQSTYGAHLMSIEDDINLYSGVEGSKLTCYSNEFQYCVSAVKPSGDVVCLTDSGQIGNTACSGPAGPC
jgi:hypothetical protein